MGKDSDDLQLREYLLEKGFLKERSGKEEIEARLIKEQKADDAKKKILNFYILKGNKNCYVYGIRKVNKCRICGNTDLKLVSIPFKGRSNRHYNARFLFAEQ